jgi:hypothetical protein
MDPALAPANVFPEKLVLSAVSSKEVTLLHTNPAL